MTGRQPATAARRTELLHRMLLQRAEQQDVQLGGEAVAVGLRCALGPVDTLVRAGPALAVERAHDDILRHRPAIVLCLVAEHDTPGLTPTLHQAIDEGLPVLFCCADDHDTQPPGSESLPADTVDGTDVEAVALAAQTAVHPLRAGAGPGLLHLRTYVIGPGPSPDPIRILADRMRTDHQLDDNALAAIESHVATQISARRKL